MTMINDIAEALMRQSQQPGCPRDASVGLRQRDADQITLTLMHFLFKRAGNRTLDIGGGRIPNTQSSTSA